MKSIIDYLLILSVLSATAPWPASAQATRALSTADIASRAVRATGTIYALDAAGDTLAQGSGFVVGTESHVITNHHVLAGASRAVIVLGDGRPIRLSRVLAADESLDLAVLQPATRMLPRLPSTTKVPRPGERVVVVGSPRGLEQTVTEGIVSAVRTLDEIQHVQISAAISPGSSGGPVFDSQGRVFAVSTWYLRESQALNFAIPLRYALDIVDMSQEARSVAAVFANATPNRSSEPELPRRATNVRSGPLLGDFSVEERWRVADDGRTYRISAQLHLGAEVGLYTMLPGSSGNPGDTALVYRVERNRVSPSGDVVLAYGGETLGGFVTEDGGIAALDTIYHAGKSHFGSIRARPMSNPLTAATGVYTARVIARWFDERGEPYGSAKPWEGELAISRTRGEIVVDLTLRNAQGGSTGMIARGPLVGNSFSVTDRGGSRLTGTLRDGELTAEWIDMRSGGSSFRGRLTAERR